MNVVIIGSGNVATVLGRLITRNHHKVIQVTSRNAANAKILADELGCAYTDYNGQIDKSADLYIIAVSDMAIHECVQHYNIHDKIVVHTAGSVSKDVLKNTAYNYGVLYPLQSLRREMQEIPHMPFLIDGNNDTVMKAIYDFAITLSPHVQVMHDEDRLKLHAAAVIVSNFTNHLYAIAEDFCKSEHVDFNLLKPLILETAARIKDKSPSEVQTGPAVRKDIHTLDKHLRILTNHPKLRTTYMRLTDSIMNP
jgi:predicted short-subunit dehydrogenase-like oxidoreductase (DUF2520 family)